jgi:hypothetical protein
MDVEAYFEGSDDVVVVTAKHVGTLGKSASIRTMLGLNGSTVSSVVNKSALCQVDAVPSMQEYYTGNVNCKVSLRCCVMVPIESIILRCITGPLMVPIDCQ